MFRSPSQLMCDLVPPFSACVVLGHACHECSLSSFGLRLKAEIKGMDCYISLILLEKLFFSLVVMNIITGLDDAVSVII